MLLKQRKKKDAQYFIFTFYNAYLHSRHPTTYSLILGERYVYKFVCDPDALFQMALAENHRTALKMEATCIAAATTGTSGSNSGTEKSDI